MLQSKRSTDFDVIKTLFRISASNCVKNFGRWHPDLEIKILLSEYDHDKQQWQFHIEYLHVKSNYENSMLCRGMDISSSADSCFSRAEYNAGTRRVDTKGILLIWVNCSLHVAIGTTVTFALCLQTLLWISYCSLSLIANGSESSLK